MVRVLSGTAVGAERAGTRSFGPDWNWHPTAEFFLPSQFVFSSGELGVGRTCCAAQADRDLSETPPRHGRWSTTGGTSAGAWGVWAKHRGGCSLRDRRGRCAPLDATSCVKSPRAKKERPHSTCTHPQRAYRAPLRHRALLGTLGVSRHVHTTHSTARAVPHAACVCVCVASGAVALCRHVNE